MDFNIGVICPIHIFAHIIAVTNCVYIYSFYIQLLYIFDQSMCTYLALITLLKWNLHGNETQTFAHLSVSGFGVSIIIHPAKFAGKLDKNLISETHHPQQASSRNWNVCTYDGKIWMWLSMIVFVSCPCKYYFSMLRAWCHFFMNLFLNTVHLFTTSVTANISNLCKPSNLKSCTLAFQFPKDFMQNIRYEK